IFHLSIVLSAVIVLGYIFLGGLTSAIYNEVLQFFLIIAGFLPLVLIGLKNVGGWSGLKQTLPQAFTHSWQGMAHANTNPLGVEVFGLAMGLGFVLSFGYWCTDFLVIQTAMATDTQENARRVPLIAAIPKMFFPFLVVLPGLLALAATTPKPETTTRVEANGAIVRNTSFPTEAQMKGHGLVPAKTDPLTGKIVLDASGKPQLDYDLAIPSMLLHYFPTGLLGLGLTALLASFMSGMAGNVTAFNTVWTYDLYQSYIKKGASDAHYLAMGRWATVGGILLSMLTAYAASGFNNIMDTLQLIFGFVNAPLFATFLLGMFWKRTTANGAFFGLISGTTAALIHHGLTLPIEAHPGIHGGWIQVIHQYPSDMAQNFWTAIWAFSTNFIVTILISLFGKPKPESELVGLVHSLTPKPDHGHLPFWKRPEALAILLIVMVVSLNLIFR
ncbi:MAG TPA: Na+/galactose cotransporter, partial [Acidobacteriaceae bacterium]